MPSCRANGEKSLGNGVLEGHWGFTGGLRASAVREQERVGNPSG